MRVELGVRIGGRGVSILSKLQVPISSGLEVKAF